MDHHHELDHHQVLLDHHHNTVAGRVPVQWGTESTCSVYKNMCILAKAKSSLHVVGDRATYFVERKVAVLDDIATAVYFPKSGVVNWREVEGVCDIVVCPKV